MTELILTEDLSTAPIQDTDLIIVFLIRAEKFGASFKHHISRNAIRKICLNIEENWRQKIGKLPYVSRSYSHDLAVIAVSTYRPVGIDLERETTLERITIAETFFSPHEQQMLQTLNDKATIKSFLTQLWVLKEALLKFQGKTVPSDLGSASLVSLPAKIQNLIWPCSPFSQKLGKSEPIFENLPSLVYHWSCRLQYNDEAGTFFHIGLIYS